MMVPPSALKRKESTGAAVSPPPLRRKVQSTTTQNSVASFFTPISQKPPEKVSWQQRGPNDQSPTTLLVGKYEHVDDSTTALESVKRHRIAAFDFDSTLITTSSGKKFATESQDWTWWHPTVPGTLRKLYLEEGYRVVVLSNQAGLDLHSGRNNAVKVKQNKLAGFKAKVTAVFCSLDFPVSIYAATEKDIFRKPRTGMWKELLNDYQLQLPGDVDLENSIFVGDAGGRDAGAGKLKDFSCSDRNFAENIGIKFFTPEEYFLGAAPRPFTRSFEPAGYLSDGAGAPEVYLRKNVKDIVLCCGSPGAGKSTFYWKQLQPLDYERVNQDTLKTRERCVKVASDYLDAGKSVAIDNTNPDVEVRSRWVELARKHSVPIRCVLFAASPELCEHNDVVRALNEIMNPEKRTILPALAFRGFSSRYQRPQLSEGFQDITEVSFKFDGAEAEREIWTRHWT